MSYWGHTFPFEHTPGHCACGACEYEEKLALGFIDEPRCPCGECRDADAVQACVRRCNEEGYKLRDPREEERRG